MSADRVAGFPQIDASLVRAGLAGAELSSVRVLMRRRALRVPDLEQADLSEVDVRKSM
jgi:hypothetical protein